MKSPARLDSERDGRVAVLVLDVPEKRNATSIAMLDAMDARLDELEDAGTAEVLLLAGDGPSFCAGLDLDEVRADDATVRRLLQRLGDVMRRLRRLEPVTIAAVQGAAIGGGFGFLCACDFAVVDADAKVGYPAPATGLSPALMAPWLFRKIGPSRARTMMLRGGTIDGRAALATGVATDLVEDGDPRAAALALADRLLTAPGDALRRLKRFLGELDESFLHDDVLDRAAQTSAEVMIAPASRDALARLLDRAD